MKYEVLQISVLEIALSQIFDNKIQKSIYVTLLIGVDVNDAIELTFTIPIQDGELTPLVEFDEKYLDFGTIIKAEVGFLYLSRTPIDGYEDKIRPKSELMSFYKNKLLPFVNEK